MEGREVAREVELATEMRAAVMVRKVEVATVVEARQGATVAMVGSEATPQHTP